MYHIHHAIIHSTPDHAVEDAAAREWEAEHHRQIPTVLRAGKDGRIEPVSRQHRKHSIAVGLDEPGAASAVALATRGDHHDPLATIEARGAAEQFAATGGRATARRLADAIRGGVAQPDRQEMLEHRAEQHEYTSDRTGSRVRAGNRDARDSGQSDLFGYRHDEPIDYGRETKKQAPPRRATEGGWLVRAHSLPGPLVTLYDARALVPGVPPAPIVRCDPALGPPSDRLPHPAQPRHWAATRRTGEPAIGGGRARLVPHTETAAEAAGIVRGIETEAHWLRRIAAQARNTTGPILVTPSPAAPVARPRAPWLLPQVGRHAEMEMGQ